MATRNIVENVPKETTIYVCDHCGGDIGPAPIHEFGGYFASCTVAPRNDKRPLWMATLCAACMNELREWAGGAA